MEEILKYGGTAFAGAMIIFGLMLLIKPFFDVFVLLSGMDKWLSFTVGILLFPLSVYGFMDWIKYDISGVK